jgi:hypothetical protein
MTNDDGRKPEGAPERSPKAGVGAPSGVDGNQATRGTVVMAGMDGKANSSYSGPEAKSGSRRLPVPRSRATGFRGLPGGYRRGIASLLS